MCVCLVHQIHAAEERARRAHLERSGAFDSERGDMQRILDPLLPDRDDDDESDDDDDSDSVDHDGRVDRESAIRELKELRERHGRSKDDSDDDDDDESSDDDSDGYLYGDDSDDDDGSDGDSDALDGWGKKDFHIDRRQQQQESRTKKRPASREQKLKMREEELQDQLDEEDEVQELEKERRGRLRMQDYLDDMIEDVSAGSRKALGKDSSRMLAELNEMLGDGTQGDKKDQTKTMSKGQMLKAIMKESPELIELIDDLNEKLTTVKKEVEPLLRRARQGNFATEEGISYLEAKYHLLLSYCIDIVFYLMLKASGRQVKDHPVINHLVELRVLIEQIKPIDDRMKYQLDKLVQLANTTNLTAQMDRIDLQHRPNPANLVRGAGASTQQSKKSKRVAFAEDDSEDDFDEYEKKKPMLDGDEYDDSDESEDSGMESDGGDSSDGDEEDADEDENDRYVPPKIIPVEYDESGDKKLRRKQRELERRLQRSQMVREIKAAMSDGPEQSYSIGAEQTRDPTLNRANRLAKEIEDHDLENFTRSRLSKKLRKELAEQQNRPYDALHEFNNLTDNTLSRLDDMFRDREQASNSNKRVTLMQYIADDDNDDVMEEVNKHLGIVSGKRDRKSKSKKRSRSDIEDEGDGDNDGASKKKKSKSKRRPEDRIAEDEQLFASSARDEDGKLAATQTIMENRGLKRYKNKAKGKNPRTKLRNKYRDKTGDMRKMENMAKNRGSSKLLREVQGNVVRSQKFVS